MNIADLHQQEKEVSAINFFKGELGTATTIQLERNGTLKEHITKTPALLLCVSGVVTYEDVNEQKIKLQQGDYILITPNLKHWLLASAKSQLILYK
ncbi:cupin domain-containing protein [Myroides odoratus]|uniref:cupin domain-containing protein n=1 Tax=Leadbetterella sp. DM7 TaxID=3235085 RepID=UPI002CD2C70B|nr:cupin domain-containing protein [Flavobacterium sp.]